MIGNKATNKVINKLTNSLTALSIEQTEMICYHGEWCLYNKYRKTKSWQKKIHDREYIKIEL